jgi:hypothetical protein
MREKHTFLPPKHQLFGHFLAKTTLALALLGNLSNRIDSACDSLESARTV